MKTSIELRLEKDLHDLTENSLYRSIPEFKHNCGMIDCATNSYLNLDTNHQIEKAANSMISTTSGNLASRLIRSGSPLFSELECEIAEWKGTESALLFNSGYAANTGIIQALARRSTVVFSDRLNHASIVDGIVLSGAKMVRYDHNNIYDLESKINDFPDSEKIIITDALFSMDGDIADLVRIARIADQTGSLLMVDEAHSSGVYGHAGNGLVHEMQLSDSVDIIVGTLSKALSGVGGYFAGSRLIRNYLINKSRSFIYSTALPESCLARNLAAVRYIRHHPRLGSELIEMAHEFRASLTEMGYNIGASVSYIIPIITGSAEKAIALSDYLAKQNIIAPAIRTPTVPVGQSRVRLSLHHGITRDELAHLQTTFEGASLWVNADS